MKPREARSKLSSARVSERRGSTPAVEYFRIVSDMAIYEQVTFRFISHAQLEKKENAEPALIIQRRPALRRQ